MSGPAAEQLNPVDLIQTKLGVSAAEAEDLANIEIICPVKDESGEMRQTSLGQFMTSEHGADHASTILDRATEARERGAQPEESLAQALGFAAVRTETGGLARFTQRQPQPRPEEAEKK